MVAGALDGAAHGAGPVLVVAGEDQAAVAGGVDAAGVQIAGVGVGEVVAVALGPADEVVGVAHVQGQARARVGAVEGDGDGGVALAEQPALLVPGVVEARARSAVLRVEVVGLPGDVGQQEQQIGRMVVAHREGDVRAVSVGGRQDRHVGADAPVRGDLEPPGQPPVVAGDGAVGGQGRGLDDAGEPGTGGDLGGAVAAVVPDAVHVHGELLGRVHGDVEVDGLTGRDGSGGGEPLDLPVHVVGGTGAARATGARDLLARPGGHGRVHVPGHDLAVVVVVELAPPEPRQGALAEGIGHRVRERTRLPTPDLLRTHTPVPLPRSPERRDRSPAHHITHALRHRSSRKLQRGSRWGPDPVPGGRRGGEADGAGGAGGPGPSRA